MRELTTEERAALVKALDSGLVSLHVAADITDRLLHIGLAERRKLDSGAACVHLTPAGHIVATLLRDAPPPSDLTRA